MLRLVLEDLPEGATVLIASVSGEEERSGNLSQNPRMTIREDVSSVEIFKIHEGWVRNDRKILLRVRKAGYKPLQWTFEEIDFGNLDYLYRELVVPVVCVEDLVYTKRPF